MGEERPRRRTRPWLEKRDRKRQVVSQIREVLLAALKDEGDLVGEMNESMREHAVAKLNEFPTLVKAAETLEPILADAVARKPSLLGRLAHGTAQLLSTLATQDGSSNRRLADLAGSSHVGIVFVDVESFTEYTATNGDGAAVELVGRLEREVSGVCRQHGGEIVKHLGDGFLLAFPSAAPAVAASLDLIDAIETVRANNPRFPLVRIGVHAGRPSIERDDLIGNDVNITARILDQCDPGKVLITKEAKVLAEQELPSIQFSDAGQLKVRGIPGPIAVCIAERPGDAA